LGNLKTDRPPTIRSNSSFRSDSSFRTARDDSDHQSEDEDPELGSAEKTVHTSLPPPIDTTNLTARAQSSTTHGPSKASFQHDHNELQANWEGHEEKGLTETQKLQVIIEEFGEVDSLMETLDGKPGPSERILAESHGSLYR
jgi:hypothetical protein